MGFEPSNQADFLVSVEGFDGMFANLSPIEVSGAQTEVYDGGSLDPYILGGRASAQPFDLSRPFSRNRDMAAYAKYLPKVNTVHLNVNLYPTDRQLKRDGRYFQGRALLTKMVLPGVDSSTQGTPSVPMFSISMRAPKWIVV